MKPVAIALGAMLLAALTLPLAAQQEQQKSIDKQGLWTVLKKGSLPAEDLIGMIEDRGVDFQLSADDEKQLRSMRVEEKVIVAVRDNYRPPAGAQTQELILPDGPPLTENQVLLLLEVPIPSRTISRLVEKRKAAFTITPDLGRILMAAGARPGLIGTIMLNSAAPPPPPPPPPPTPTPTPTPTPAPVVQQGGAPVQAPAGQQAARLLRRTPVLYPKAAVESRTQGVVVVAIVVAVDGSVKSARAISGPYALRQAAVESVRRWQYAPAILNGVPVEAAIETSVDFTLR